jgi:hypothetical protein
MALQSITLEPDFSGCEPGSLSECFWRLLQTCAVDPNLHERFRIYGPDSGEIELSEDGFAITLSGGHLLVFDPDYDFPNAAEDGCLEILSVGPHDITVQTQQAIKPVISSRPELTVMADPEHIFAPIWDVGANQLYCYITRLLWNGPGGRQISEQSVESYGISLDRLLAVDLDAAARTVETVRQTPEAFGAGSFAIPVHPKVLEEAASRWNDEMWSLVLPVLDQIIFEIVLDYTTPANGQVETSVAVLQDFGRPILLRTGPGADKIGSASRLPVDAVGFDGGPLAKAHCDMSGFDGYSAATENGMPNYVMGLTSVAPTAAAISAGFTFVGSDAISPSSRCETAHGVSDDPAALLRTLIAHRSAANGI